MSEARALNMAKLAASIDETEETAVNEEPEQVDSRLETEQDVPGKKELSTRQEINLLKKAKLHARSETVRAKLQEEIEAAETRASEEKQAEKERLTTIETAKGTGKAASNVVSGIVGAADNVGEKVGDVANKVGGTISQISTPGSIFLPLSLLLVFFFLLLPVNGMTRAQWLYAALIGNAQINGTANAAPQTSQQTQPPDQRNQQQTPQIQQTPAQQNTGIGDVGYKRSVYGNPYIRRKDA